MLWRGGCIIRAAFLEDIKAAFDRDAGLDNLLLDPHFRQAVEANQDAWREVVATSARIGLWTPAFAAALAYFDGYRSEHLPHNLLQAQRDYFGSHGYQRIDRPGTFHTDWLGLRREPPG
jgi:6-phosphogluconate dehydrogenase